MKANIDFEKKPLLSSLLINLLLFSVVYLIYRPRFATNDDPIMMLFSAGTSVTTQPSEYLIYTNVLIGVFLKNLYLLAPSVSWYGVYLAGGVFVAHVSFLYIILKNRLGVVGPMLYIAYFLLFGISLAINLQFTITAFLLCFAGALLIYIPFALSDRDDGFRYITWRNGIGIIFIILGSMVRSESLVLTILLMVPLALTDLMNLRKWKELLRRGILIAFAILLAVGFGQFNKYFYQQSHSMKDYYEFNSLRAQLIDNRILEPVTPHKQIIIENAGWSFNDYKMLRSWIFMDEKIYSIENFKKIVHEVRDKRELKVELMLKTYLNIIGLPLFFNAVLILVLVALIAKKEKIFLFKLISVFISFTMVFFLISYFVKIPPTRVLLPMMAFIALTPISLLNYTTSKKFFYLQLLEKMALILIALLLMRSINISIQGYNNLSKQNIYRNDWLKSTLSGISTSEKQFYFSVADAFPWEYISPFERIDYLRSFNAIVLGWPQRAVPSKKMLEHYGIKDIYRSIIDDPNIVFLIRTDRTSLYETLIKSFIKEHYATELRMKIASINSEFAICKFERITK